MRSRQSEIAASKPRGRGGSLSSRDRDGKREPPTTARGSGARPSPPEPPDRVERESEQSFPASDPPGWIASWNR